VAVGELDGRPVVVSANWDRTVWVWDLASGDPVGEPLTGHTESVKAVAIGELDGHPVVVSASMDHTVRVWDLASGDPVGEPLTGHTDEVTAVAVGERDAHPVVVSASMDGTVRVWDLASVGSHSRAIRLGVGILSVTKPINNVVVVGHLAGLTAIRI
jgi:WD40 repeat protein